MAKMAPYALTALIGVGGGGVGIPLVWPNLGAPDRFTSKDWNEQKARLNAEWRQELRQLQQQSDEIQQVNRELRQRLDLFAVTANEAARNTRENQAAIIVAIERTTELLREMQMAQLRHFADEHRNKD